MNETFEEKLEKVKGTIHRVVMNDPFQRYSGGLLYWSNKAGRLHDASLLLEGDPFDSHFESFALLAGFSLELLIKGTLIGLGEKLPHTHNIVKLSDKAGLEVSSDDRKILKAFTVYTTWYSRYPAAKNAAEMEQGMEVIEGQFPRSGRLDEIASKARTSIVAVNATNYERLYKFYLDRFFEVQSSVFESAEFSVETPHS